MRFLLDVNVGTTIARAIVAAGHEVVRAAIEHPTDLDVTILARAVREERVLVTCDRDFGELVYQYDAAQPPAIIYIRYEPDDIAEVVVRLMPLLDFSLLQGHMTIIGHEHIRRRPFPAKSEHHG